MAEAPPKVTTIDEPTTEGTEVDAQPVVLVNDSPVTSATLDNPGGH